LISRDLKSLLKSLGLLNTHSVFFFNEDDGETFAFPSKETEKKFSIIRPTAYYIFNNQPYILFFDLTNDIDSSREKDIHKQVWSFDQSPLVFIIKDNDISIYNAFSYDKRLKQLQEITFSKGENIHEIFSFWNLQSGKTWIWLQENYYKNTIQKKRVNQKLFENIKFVRETLINKSEQNERPLLEDEANILILRLIFIRYLIDRNVKLDTDFIKGATILDRKKSFSDLIETPKKLNSFFEKLNEKFHGVLFKDIKIQLSKKQATSLALVFNGEKPEEGSLFAGTNFYFEIFDFSIIPVEVISGIYESLIDQETRKLQSAVYTPAFLVEYILTNTIDDYFNDKINEFKTECKVFDPSVGSGIFLVQAFRRMIDKEILLSKEKKISKVRLREIAQNNLFGIDINIQALKVTCFSIYIAMLDYQDPKTILDNFHFPKLIDENFFNANFFDDKHIFNDRIKCKGLDFILGNPPWKKNKSPIHLAWVNSIGVYSNKIKGEIEIAQSFLLRSKDFMLENTSAALIVTSTIFYNVSNSTREFKNNFLKQFCISNFFDLSAVKQSLFEQQESPASIIFYSLTKFDNNDNNVVSYQSLKPNLFLKYFKVLVIEKFDKKLIKQKHFLENDWMFKVALYGNTLDFIFLKRLESIKLKVKDLIDDKIIFKGAGIERGENSKPFPELLGMPIVDNNEIKEYYTNVNLSKILNESDVNLSRGRRLEIFKGNKILLKEQSKDWNQPVVSFSALDFVFRKGSFAISSYDSIAIKNLYTFLISNLNSYYLFNISCAWGIGTRPAIRFDEEFLSFPYMDPNLLIKSKLVNLANEFLSQFESFYHSFRLGEPNKDQNILNQINLLIEELYEVKPYEKDLIDFFLDISRYQFQESKLDRIIRKVHNDMHVLERYSEIFISEFEKIYDDEYLHIDVYPLDHFIAINFRFENEKPNRNVNVVVENDYKKIFKSLSSNISISKVAKDIYVQKDIKGFEENSFYIIKPNEYKCWHRAIAWYDVAEIKEAIQSAELQRLNTKSN